MVSVETEPTPEQTGEVPVTLAPSNYPISVKDVIPSGDLPVVGTNTKYRMIYMNMGHGKDGEKIYSDPIEDNALRQHDSLAWHKGVVSSRRKKDHT